MNDEKPSAGGPGSGEEIGSVAEEAAKLLGALSGWAHEHGDGLGHGFADVAAGAARAAHDVQEHLATGPTECTYCPVCRVVHLVRGTSPEVKEHLAVAATSLMQAAAGLLATVAPDEGRTSTTSPGSGIEHIDLDADWPEDD